MRLPDAVETGRERCGERQVRIAVGSGNAAFDAQTLSGAHDAETGGAIVVAPGDPSRRPRGGNEPLIGVDRGCIKHHDVGHVRHPPAEEPAEEIGALHRAELLIAIERVAVRSATG